jgi:colanic acid/amylovoran biosynthesis protein
MRIVLTAVSGCRSRGVEALLVSTLDGFSSVVSDASFTIVSTDPQYDQMVLGDRATALDDCAALFFGRRRLAARAMLSRVYPALFPAYHRLRKALDGADLVVATGGDMFSSDYGSRSMMRHLRVLGLAQQLGRRTAFLAQSIGPFRTKTELEAWRAVARKAGLVTVRERRSYDYVTSTAGIPREKVVLVADPAFTLQPARPERVAALRRSFGLDEGVSTVALAPSQGITTYSGADTLQHDAAWERVIHHVIDRLGAQVLLVPHVHDNRPHNDDRMIVSRLLERCGFNPRIRAALGELRAADFKGLIGSCDMVVGERMHACVAGLSSGVCTMAVGYSVKAEGMIGEVLGPDLGRYALVPVEEFIAGRESIQAIDTLWHRRDECAAILRSKLPELMRMAASSFQRILGSH